jgi:hypothetical protein
VLSVDPAAVEEVSGIGTVVARTEDDPMYENTILVLENMLIDVGASGGDEALEIARGRLEQRGWKVVGSSYKVLFLESARWEGTSVNVTSVEQVRQVGPEPEGEILQVMRSDPEKADEYLLGTMSSEG